MRSSIAPRFAAFLGALLLLVGSEARAEERPEADVPPDAAPASSWPASTWRVEAGYRGSFIPDAAFDPFASDDFLPQLSIGASRTLVRVGRASFAVGMSWDHGRASATARGAATSLSLDRFAIPLEARLHVDRWGYAFVRLAPGVVAQHVRVEDASAPAAYTAGRALFATDVSAGYALPLWRLGNGASPARAWLQADGGYGWVAAERLRLTADVASDDPLRARGVDLGSLSTRGAFFRAAVAISF